MASAKDRQVGGEHYRKHKIQPWDIWEEYDLDPFTATVIKYLLRDKDDRLEDLRKARHTLDRLIEIEEAKAEEAERERERRHRTATATPGYEWDAANLSRVTGIPILPWQEKMLRDQKEGLENYPETKKTLDRMLDRANEMLGQKPSMTFWDEVNAMVGKMDDPADDPSWEEYEEREDYEEPAHMWPWQRVMERWRRHAR